jgi:DNA repair protein RecO (recombination protein O)
LPLVERVYRVDRTVAEHRVSLFGQDVAHGDQADAEGGIPPIASGA